MTTAIRVELQLANGDFTSGMLRAGQSIAQFQRELIRANPSLQALANGGQGFINVIDRADGQTRGFVASLRDLSIITGVVSLGIGLVSRASNGWAGDIVRINAEMQRLMVQMRSMARSGEPIKEAAENVAFLRDMAMQSPFALDQLAKSFVKLQATGIDPMNGSMQSLVDGVAAFGGTEESLSRVTLAISQISGKGVLQMEELRQQLGESMPRAVELMARSMGVGMAELIQQISTGRVRAGPALQALYDELDRTYGGRAKQMMQTFDGQLKQTTTLWQTLMTTVGGLNQETGQWAEGGFFDTVTQQLTDLNEVLARPMALGFAKDIGAGMANVINFIRDTITDLIAFRREITNVALIIGGAFAFKTAIAGLGALSGAIAMTTFEMQRAAITYQAAGRWLGLASIGFQGLRTSAMGAHMALIGVGTALKGVAIGFMAALPWVAAIGIAAYTAAEYFDIFGNKVRNAYDDLVKFGGETRAQVREITDARKKQLDEEIATLEKTAKLWKGSRMEEQQNAALQAAYKEREDLVRDSERLLNEAGEREKERALTEYQKGLDAELAMSQTRYDEESVRAQQAADMELAMREVTGKSVAEIEEKRAADLLQAHKDYNHRDLLLVGTRMAANKMAMEMANEDEKALLEAQFTQLVRHNARLLAEKTQLNVRGLDGVQLVENVPDQGKLIEQGQTRLDNLRDSVVDLRAEFFGANGEYAKMQLAIARGDYGSVVEGGEEVAKLHEELLKATRQKEMLDEMMKGRSTAEAEVERLRKKSIEDQLTAQMKLEERRSGRKWTDADIMDWKLNNNWFDGIGEEQDVRDFLDGVMTQFGEVSTAGVATGNTLKTEAFGESQVEAIKEVIGTVNLLKNAVMGVNGAGQDFDLGFGVTESSLSMRSPLAGSDYRSRLIGAESGGDNFAKNKLSSATGVGQFIESTWMEFLAEMHPAMAELPRQQALALRTNNDYMLQAIDWYTNKNARALAAAGNTLNDANLYLAHFLGPGGANKVLGASDGAALSSLLDGGQMAANPFMQGKSVGWLKQWSQNKMGSGMTAQVSGTGGGPVAPVSGLSLPELAQGNQLLAEREVLVKEHARIKGEMHEEVDAARTRQINTEELVQEEAKLALVQKLKDDIDAAGLSTDKLGSAYKMVVEAIQAGAIGDSKDVGAEEYRDLLALATEADAVAKKIKETGEAKTASESQLQAIEEQRLKINQQIADTNAKIKDPNFQGMSNELITLNAQLDEYIENQRIAFGEDSTEYKAALQFKTDSLQQQRLLEATTEAQARDEQTRGITTSLMTQAQQRKLAFDRQMALIDAEAQRWREAGMAEIEITRQVEAAKAAERAKYATETSPMTQQMKEWANLQGNLTEQSTQWMESIASGMADVIMGTGDLRSVMQGITSDLVNTGLRYVLSQMMGGGGMGGGMGKGGGMTKIPGNARGTSNWRGGITRIHEEGGEIMDLPRGTRIIPHDVSMKMARRGELGTPEGLGRAGAFTANSNFQISAPVTVNGSAGTPAQNDDLARKVAREMENTMRGIAAKEIASSQRVGNTLNTRSRS